MSSSTRGLRLLLDENVRVELAEWLKFKQIDAKQLTRGAPDTLLAATSKRERRALVTNDRDFSQLTRDTIFAVIWLRIPQKDADILISAFEKMLTECKAFAGKLVTVDATGWKSEILFARRRFHSAK